MDLGLSAVFAELCCGLCGSNGQRAVGSPHIPCERFGRGIPRGSEWNPPYSRQQVADMLGSIHPLMREYWISSRVYLARFV